MAHFSGTFCTPKPDPGPNFKKKLDPHLLDPCEKPDPVLFLNAKPTNIGVCIVHTISHIIALALTKR